MSGRPGRGFHVGQMRDRITIQTDSTTQDAAGQSVVTRTDWLLNEPAKFEPTQGGEGFRGRQVEAGIQAIFTVRYRVGYTPQQTVVHDSGTYGIVYVKPVEGLDRYRELHCKGVI